jgi:hypothetical protein
MEVPIDSIIQLTDLKFLSLPAEMMDDPENASLLKENLPETIIVPSTGICLGTGWILLFIPFILITGFIVSYFRKKRNEQITC